MAKRQERWGATALSPSGLRRSSVKPSSSGCSNARQCRFSCVNSNEVTRSALRGRAKSRRSSSMMRPGRGLITRIRSAKNSASSISWVIKTIVVLMRAHTSNSYCCIIKRVWASSDPKGSSINITRGWFISTRSISTRCFIPPESCAG